MGRRRLGPSPLDPISSPGPSGQSSWMMESRTSSSASPWPAVDRDRNESRQVPLTSPLLQEVPATGLPRRRTADHFPGAAWFSGDAALEMVAGPMLGHVHCTASSKRRRSHHPARARGRRAQIEQTEGRPGGCQGYHPAGAPKIEQPPAWREEVGRGVPRRGLSLPCPG